MREVSFSEVGPGLSAAIRFCARSPMEGNRARANTKMPIPPSQWVELRQNKMLLGKLSISRKMEAPVVVNPETDSKIQSIKVPNPPLMKKGMAPKNDMVIQMNATLTKPSLAEKMVFRTFIPKKGRAMATIPKMGIRKGTMDSL